MKQRKSAALALAVLLALALWGCGQTEAAPEEVTAMPTEAAATETAATEAAIEETVDVVTESKTFEDGTVAETVTTVETLSTGERTTVQVTTTCIDGTVLVDTTVTENFRDGSTYMETRNEVRYPEGGGSVTLESQATNADMTFRQVEEFITLSPDGSTYSERTEIELDEKGNTTVRNITTQTDASGNETKDETVTVTDAEGNVVA